MPPETIPEIRRSSMASVALALKSLDIVDVLGFDFLDARDSAHRQERFTIPLVL